MLPYSDFEARVARLRERVAESCARSGRSPEAVRILPVTKTHPVWAAEFAARAGFAAVGENRVQEAAEKIPQAPEGLCWELIGHLQSNKAKYAVRCFDRVQSVDSLKLLKKLAAASENAGKTARILLQFNTGEDPAKFGAAEHEADAFLDAALQQPSLCVEGLMTIAPLDNDPFVARRAFARLRELRERLAASFQASLPELSMGMTSDFEDAIAEGSTMIRVGTALFGERG